MADDFRIAVLEADLLEPAFNLATEVFVTGSNLHRALNIGLSEYRAYLRPSFEEMVSEGLSMVAVDDKTGGLVGCLIATDFARASCNDDLPAGKFAPLAALTRSLCQQYRKVRPSEAGQAVLVDMGVVSTDALGEGIYQKMRDALAEHAAEIGFQHIVGELSSAAAQHVVVGKLAHEVVAEVAFEDFEFEGKHPFSSIKEPRSIILAEGKLQSKPYRPA